MATSHDPAEDGSRAGERAHDTAVTGGDASRNCTPDALVALSRAVTTARLLAGVVHEMNNTLLVITGTVELLQARGDLPPGAGRPLERLRTQSDRMATAMTQVAAFTQAPLGGRGNADLGELARVSVDLRKFAISRAGLTVRFADESQPCLVLGSRGELQQAILNLIINAEYALAGTRGQIDVEVARRGDWAIVRVSDSRPRPPTASDDLFEPFVPTRAPSDTSGLNLFAARAIAEAHGGVLAVEESGAGASFIVRLPALSGARR